MIGGSIGLALRAQGWHVTGRDLLPEVDGGGAGRWAPSTRSVSILTAEVCFVASPVSAIAAAARELLDQADWVVTDVGSVKSPMLPLMADPRFVGGHPMAGSEQEGVDGARADLFEGRTVGPDAAGRHRRRGAARALRAIVTVRRRGALARPIATTPWSPPCRTCPTSPPPRSCGWPTGGPCNRARVRSCAWPPAGSAT
ncbi:MAG: prephenate dehydrogenase/arogenate dehydrogenase family protein [Microthrixaceae bacterium]